MRVSKAVRIVLNWLEKIHSCIHVYIETLQMEPSVVASMSQTEAQLIVMPQTLQNAVRKESGRVHNLRS